MNIHVTFDSSWNAQLFNPAQMETAIRNITSVIGAHIANPITININFGYGEVNGAAMVSTNLGQSFTPTTGPYTYAQILSDYDTLATHSNNADFLTAVSNLPATNPTPNGSSFELPRAQDKLFGILPANDSAIDGYVGIANNVTWDLNNQNGITAGSYDLFGTVAHEVSEVLGRFAGLGAPFTKGDGTLIQVDTPYDLFRYQFIPHFPTPFIVHDFVGTHPDYFSIDGGKTDINDFNTNPANDFADWASTAGNDSFLAGSNHDVVNAFTVADGQTLSALGYEFSDQDPVANIDTAFVQENAVVTGNVITTGAGADSDPEGDLITITEIAHFDPVSHHLFVGTVGSPITGSYGFLTINADGSYTYVADLAQPLPRGTTVTDTFLYFESDGLGGTANAALNVNVTGIDPLISDIWSSSDNGAVEIGPGRTVTITVWSTEAVNVTGAPSLALNNGENATFQGGSGTTALTFIYTVQPGDDVSDLQIVGLNMPAGASIADASGVALAGSVIKDLFFIVDTTPPAAPVISGISPATGTIPAGEITDQSVVTVSGTSELFTVITLYDGATLIGTANVDDLGNWSIDNVALASGINDLTAVATDDAGNAASSDAFDAVLYSDSVWANPVNGNWNNAANWSPAARPGALSNADLIAGHYMVTDAKPTEVFSLTIEAGATLKLTGGTFTDDHGTGPGINAGMIKVESGATFTISGAFANTDTGMVSAAAGATIDLNGGDITGGKLSIAAGATLETTGGPTSSIATGNTIANGGVIEVGAGNELTIVDAIKNAAGASLVVDGGILAVDGAITGSGTASIEDGILAVHGATSLKTVTFVGSNATLDIDLAHSFRGALAGFGSGDTIDLTGIQYSNVPGARTVVKYTDDGTGLGGTLMVRDAAGDVAKLTMVGSYTTQNFAPGDDGSGHVVLHFHDLLV